MAKLDELKQEAKELGIQFSPNISENKLADRIEEYYKNREEQAAKNIEAKVEKKEEEESKTEQNTAKTLGQRAREAEAKARITHIITITDNDQRENNLTTTVPVTCGNDYFDLGTKKLPLNVSVEVEQGFINVLKEIVIPLAVRQPDGSTRTVLRKRYSISYEDELKKEEE